ncbi:tumor necrosis factor receptor superfamily member 6 [Echeneis naucrates]|uniref:Tumor necrosis factor receptor superfamily member 6-like n=1 Tax=Echeneis naucrates TaxID=173247 RepID=A0A665XAG9_ECHNA|nr:tumor necrosis factor receptor superfamily member 6-like [Echeneis naucrates]
MEKLLCWLALCSCVYLVLSSVTSPALQPAKRPRRLRRQGGCQDGTYTHEGRTCCLCAAGERLVRHCQTTPNDGQCESCEHNTYNTHPNSQTSCQPCTSCDHPNANLMLAEPCTRAQDAKCQCKMDHYCTSGTDICHLCTPCKKCGAEGVKIACTYMYNTVCNPETEEKNTGMIGGIVAVVLIVFVIAGLALVWYWLRKKSRQTSELQPSPSREDEELPCLDDFEHHLPDIADVCGWAVIKDIAMRSGMPPTAIDSCQLDYPNNSREQTLQLLRMWVEKEGSGSSEKFIKILQRTGRRGIAEKVMMKLKNDA